VANYQRVDHSNAPFSACGASIFTIPNTVWSARIAISANTMHEGIDRSGNHLFPAFPYDHFTKVGDDDVAAIYAFLMTREPLRVNVPPNSVPVPRPLLAAWNALYLHGGPFQPDPLRTAVWNRGAYLAEGHCNVNFGRTRWSSERLVCARHVACRAHVSWCQTSKATDRSTRYASDGGVGGSGHG
jgi:hypothetical protein